MRLHKCIFIGIVSVCAIGLAFPQASFGCWFTGEYTYECCTACCLDATACASFRNEGDRTQCTYNWYCVVNPFYCFVTVCPAKEGEFCPFRYTVEDDQTKLDVLREMRDTRLLKTALGKSLVDLYYQHAEEVTAILIDDEDLLALSANITDEIVERALEADSDGEMIIDLELVESALEVMDLIDEGASPELSRTIQMVQRELKRRELFRKMGITVD